MLINGIYVLSLDFCVPEYFLMKFIIFNFRFFLHLFDNFSIPLNKKLCGEAIRYVIFQSVFNNLCSRAQIIVRGIHFIMHQQNCFGNLLLTARRSMFSENVLFSSVLIKSGQTSTFQNKVIYSFRNSFSLVFQLQLSSYNNQALIRMNHIRNDSVCYMYVWYYKS